MKEKRYVLDRTKLEPCDIILTSNKSFSSKGIRLATLGKYSHAAIHMDGTTIEATLKGVFSKSTQRLIFDEENQAAVFRSKKPLSDNEIRRICNYARSLTGSLYALPEALTIRVLSSLKIQETRKQFCSRLVAESYNAAGYDLANLRNPAYCTPKQLALCKSFYQVQDVLKLACQAEIVLAESTDPNTEHQLQTFMWLNKVRDLVEENSSITTIDIQTINDVDMFLLKYPQYDATVSDFMKNTDYLYFHNYDAEVNRYRYDEKLFQVVLQKQPSASAFIEEHLDIEPGLFYKYTQNLEGYIQYMNEQKLQFFHLHIDLYTNLIKHLYRRLNVYIAGCISIGESKWALDLNKLNSIILNAIHAGEKALTL